MGRTRKTATFSAPILLRALFNEYSLDIPCTTQNPERQRAGNASPLRAIHRHLLPLPLDDIPHRPLHLSLTPQPPRTPVISPPPPPALLHASLIQCPRSISLQPIHHILRRSIPAHNRVHMIRPHVRRDQSPSPALANLPQSPQDNVTPLFIQAIRRLLHQTPHRLQTLPIRSQSRRPRNIMKPVDHPLLPVQMRSITNKGNQISSPSHSLPLGVHTNQVQIPDRSSPSTPSASERAQKYPSLRSRSGV